VVHSTALNSSDNPFSHPPDNHHSSDDVRWRGGGQWTIYDKTTEYKVTLPAVDLVLELRIAAVRCCLNLLLRLLTGW